VLQSWEDRHGFKAVHHLNLLRCHDSSVRLQNLAKLQAQLGAGE
jgi:hypothetical protein